METTATVEVLRRQFGIMEDGRVTTARSGRVIRGSQGSQLLIDEVEGMPFSLLGHLMEVLNVSGYKDGDRIHIEVRMKRKV